MKNLETAMKDSIFNIIETMFFLSLELNPQATITNCGLLDADRIRVSRLDFEGPFAGFFRLYVPERLLLEMTGNFMGLERRSISGAHLEGTIIELINMIVGNSLSTLDNSLEFQLGIPVTEDMDMLPEPDPGTLHGEAWVVPEAINGFLAVRAVILKK